MQVHGYRSRRLVYKEVVEKSYFWWYGNPACGDLTGSSGLKRIRLVYVLDLFEGRTEKEQCDLVCVESLWTIELMVVMLISYSHVVSVVFVLSEIVHVLRRRYGIE